jgi:hypothetical protein
MMVLHEFGTALAEAMSGSGESYMEGDQLMALGPERSELNLAVVDKLTTEATAGGREVLKHRLDSRAGPC